MKVCLFSPPTITDFEPALVGREPKLQRLAYQPPLGVLTLASVLESTGIAVRLVHVNSEYLRLGPDDFCSRLAAETGPCEVYGLSTICCSYPLTIRLARALRLANPGALIALGGPQATAVDEDTLRAFPFIDVIVRGEAEQSLPALLAAGSGRAAWSGIAGLTFRRARQVVRTPDAPVIGNLDTLPLPAFHLFPDLNRCRSLPVEAGRGCPFGCTFCSTSRFFQRRARTKSPRVLVDQMRELSRRYGFNRFNMVHDLFTLDRQRVLDCCAELQRTGARFRWRCSARTDLVDDNVLSAMARAGCAGVFFGIESGSPAVQKEIRKNLDLDEARARIRAASRLGMRVTVSMIAGFPAETRADLERTLEFLLDAARSDRVETQLHVLDPLAGTKYYTAYRARLELHASSDLSAAGWRQCPEDRTLVETHPGIFPGFYTVPGGPMEPERLRELRDFVSNGLARFRWVLLALARLDGGIAAAFERWKARRREAGDPDYYGSARFREEFLSHVRAAYAEHAAISTLAAFEVSRSQPPPPARGRNPRWAEGLRVIELGADYLGILRRLRRGQRFDSVRRGLYVVATRPLTRTRVRLIQIGGPAAALLLLCDGSRDGRRIARDFAARCHPPEGISVFDSARYGLAWLRRMRLIE